MAYLRHCATQCLYGAYHDPCANLCQFRATYWRMPSTFCPGCAPDWKASGTRPPTVTRVSDIPRVGIHKAHQMVVLWHICAIVPRDERRTCMTQVAQILVGRGLCGRRTRFNLLAVRIQTTLPSIAAYLRYRAARLKQAIKNRKKGKKSPIPDRRANLIYPLCLSMCFLP